MSVLPWVLVAASMMCQSGPAVRPPDWKALPRSAGPAIPRSFLDSPTNGLVVIRCQVTVKGRAEDCTVIEEAPIDSGLGRATLRLSKVFRLTPRTVEGEPTGDGVVLIPVEFIVNKGSAPLSLAVAVPSDATLLERLVITASGRR